MKKSLFMKNVEDFCKTEMNAVFKNTRLIKAIVETTSELSNDALFHFRENGLSFQALDSSHIALSMLHINEEDFHLYSLQESISIGVSLCNLLKILKCSCNDMISFGYENDCKFLIQMSEQHKTMRFELNTMDIDQESLEAPSTVYPCTFELSSEKLKQVINDIYSLGSECSITIRDHKMIVSVEGDIGKVTTEIENVPVTENVAETRFSTKHLHTIVKAYGLSDNVILSISEDMPLLLKYPFGHASYLQFYLAPKMKTE